MLRLLRVGRNVADLDRAQAFYRDALGFHAVDTTPERHPSWAQLPGLENFAVRAVRMRLGDQEIELAEFDPPGAPYPRDSSASDLWLQHLAIVTNDMTAVHDCVIRHGATPITRDGPQTLPSGAGSVTAFKFRDPDGHPLEVIHFPPDTGDAIWQQPSTAKDTLGIDHTAISVADADRSIEFYTDLPGMSQDKRQVNHGPEQQCLDALAAVQVDVVALRTTALRPPHIELLGYREPRGRALRSMAIPDIVADRTILQVRDLAGCIEAARAAPSHSLVAMGSVDDREASRAAMLRDPDGHLLVLVE
ncbi:MAG: VOC family protein [Rhodanobacteraceae bacterium]